MEDRVFILLPVHNRKETTVAFANCLQSQTYTNYQLLLIDDGCTDGTTEAVQSIIKNLYVIQGDGSWWWSKSLNEALKFLHSKSISGESIILIINDDVTFDNEFIGTGVKLLARNPDTLLLAKHYNEETKEIEETGININTANLSFQLAKSQIEINCLTTRGLFLRWKDIESIGYFREKLLPHYFADNEYTIRAYNKGLSLITDTKLYIHFDKATSGIRRLQKGSLMQCLRIIFSKRYSRNPVYWTNLALILCPWHKKIQVIIRIWSGTLKSLYESIK